ncbi:MAG: winged helix-turn-helix domain-containing protein [Paraburkholderia tropica]
MRILCIGAERRRRYLARALEESNHSVVELDRPDDAAWLAGTELLDSGVDICFDEPCDYVELHARLQAITRPGSHTIQTATNTTTSDSASQPLLSRATRSLICSDGSALLLRRREYLLMDRLLRNPGEPVRHAELVDYVFGELEVDPTSLHRLVSRLRGRFAKAGAPVKLVVIPRLGYRAAVDMSPESAG